MSYSIRYYINYFSKYTKGTVYIDKWNNIDASESLTLLKDGITINTTFDDWNSPILGQSAQLDILNDKTDFFELLPLLSSEEREYKVRIVQTYPSTKYLFSGFLNSDVVEQTYLNNQAIRLAASNYIKKAEYVNPTFVNTIQKKTFIDIISEILSMTGNDSSIRVNMDICPSGGSIGTTKTALNLCALNTELFWKNNVERDNGLDILNKILTSFDSYIYWYDNNWYIERYEDLCKYPQHFVTYQPDLSYGYSNTGTNVSVSDTSLNIFSNNQLEKSPLISIIPGLNKIEIRLNSKDVMNFTLDSFGDAIGVEYVPSSIYPDFKQINYYKSSTYNFPGYDPFYFSSSDGYHIDEPYSVINSGMRRRGWPSFGGLIYYEKSSIATKFKITVDSSSITQNININWKYIPISVGSSPVNSYDYRLNWFLRNSPGDYFICYDSVGHHWQRISTSDPSIYTQFIDITGINLESGTNLTKVSTNINITDPSIIGCENDQEFIFGILIEKYSVTGINTYNNAPLLAAYGDIEITTSGQTPQNNLITGTVNTKFLNKKNIDLHLYDINNLNYTNGIYTGADYSNRTTLWYDNESNYLSLVDRLLKNKFQLYNKSRQSISSTIQSTNYLKPLSAWYDLNQIDKKYVLVSYSYYLTKNQYKCVWNEYDNDISINLKDA